jgi:hypothetical protein
MQEAFTPKPLQSSGASSQNYHTGGLVSFADGGMPSGAPPDQPQSGLPQPGGEESPQNDPKIMQEVQQIFEQNMQDPKMIGQLLLELVKREISKVLSPEQKKMLQTPEGEQMLHEYVQQMMEQMQGASGGGALNQMAGGSLPGMAHGGYVDSWG